MVKPSEEHTPAPSFLTDTAAPPARVSLSPHSASEDRSQRQPPSMTPVRLADAEMQAVDTSATRAKKRPRSSRRNGKGEAEAVDKASDEYFAQMIWTLELKDIGWKNYVGDGLHDHCFIPPTLVPPHQTVKKVKKYGARGVHYVMGYSGLAAYLKKYGPDSVPKDLNDKPKEGDYSLQAIYQSLTAGESALVADERCRR